MLDTFIKYLENKNRSHNTIKNYITDIKVFYRWTNENNIMGITQGTISEYETYITSCNKSPATRARILSSLKSYFTFLKSKDLIKENPTLDMSTPKINKRLPKILTELECRKLIECVDGKNKERDKAILVIFLTCGIRLSELVGINLNSIQENSLNVIGKGNKERNIPMIEMCVKSINEYLAVRKESEEIGMFLNDNGNRIKDKTVGLLVKKYLEKIGRGDLSTHKIRHSCFSMLYANGVNIMEIASIAGHESIATTQIYVHINNKKIIEAVNKNPLNDYFNETHE